MGGVRISVPHSSSSSVAPTPTRDRSPLLAGLSAVASFCGTNALLPLLIAAAADGDVAAFGRLVARYQRDAVRIAAVALGSADDADDVAQDAFVNVHRALPQFDARSSFRPWLYRIVVNTARNRHRSTARRGRLRLRVSALPTPTPAESADPANVAIQLERRHQLVAAINRLRPDDRLILTYRWFDQLTEAEIADALDCPPGTVKSRLSRAMQRLRSELGEVDIDPERIARP